MNKDNGRYSNNFIDLEDLVYTPLHVISQSNINLSESIIDLIASTGSVNPNNPLSEESIRKQTEKLNRCLNEYPTGGIIGNKHSDR